MALECALVAAGVASAIGSLRGVDRASGSRFSGQFITLSSFGLRLIGAACIAELTGSSGGELRWCGFG